MVTTYSSESAGPVQRSTRCKFWPRAPIIGLRTEIRHVDDEGIDLQWPRESAVQWTMSAANGGLPFMTRLRCQPCPGPTS